MVIGMFRGGRKEAGELRVSMLMKEEVSMLLMETDRWCRSLAETLTSRPEAPLATNLKKKKCLVFSEKYLPGDLPGGEAVASAEPLCSGL